jgi:triphosphoribosyl-dephospho-CoA synthase
MLLTVEEEISSTALEAMLHEVSVTPKPGLVDRNNSGAHRDMDFFTFISSASVIQPYFRKMALEGSSFSSDDFTLLLKKIRPIGIEAEKQMFKATSNVNTHKGLIFSLGILSCASAYLLSQGEKSSAENICRIGSLMCRDIVQNELQTCENLHTSGERLYRKDGVRGIRGEAESGFPSVLEQSLPYLRDSAGPWNQRLINTLLHLMSTVEDSNILARHNKETLESVQSQTREVLAMGGASDERGLEILRQMDLNFIEKNISPGGSADLLAVTIFLYKMETR